MRPQYEVFRHDDWGPTRVSSFRLPRGIAEDVEVIAEVEADTHTGIAIEAMMLLIFSRLNDPSFLQKLTPAQHATLQRNAQARLDSMVTAQAGMAEMSELLQNLNSVQPTKE